MFDWQKISNLSYDLYSETIDGERIYNTPDGKKYPSVTTVLSSCEDKQWLKEWKERIGEDGAKKQTRIAASIGSRLHDYLEKYIRNELMSYHMAAMYPDVKSIFVPMRKFIDKHIEKVYATEQALYSHRLRIAGRTDCIATWDGELSIVDWKNSNRQKEKGDIEGYFLQSTAYSEMFEDITGIAINRIVIVIGVHDGISNFFVEDKRHYTKKLYGIIDQYYANKQLTE